jgi:hypothetical protein
MCQGQKKASNIGRAISQLRFLRHYRQPKNTRQQEYTATRQYARMAEISMGGYTPTEPPPVYRSDQI